MEIILARVPSRRFSASFNLSSLFLSFALDAKYNPNEGINTIEKHPTTAARAPEIP